MKMRHINITLIYSLLPIIVSFSQNISTKDTSYNTYSAYHKLADHYADISIPNYIPSAGEERYIYKTIGNRALSLDFYNALNTDSKSPLIIMIHGGGWRSGDKGMMKNLCRGLSAMGYSCAAIEYRLSSEAKYPAALLDVYSSIDWAFKNASNLKIETSKIILLGCSAGAQIASLAANTLPDQIKDLNGKKVITHKIFALVNVDGIVDFTDSLALKWENKKGENSSAAKWLGGSYDTKPLVWEEASPNNYLHHETPATLFINSKYDRYHAGREYYINKLNELYIYNDIVSLNDAPHSFWLFSPWFEKTINSVDTFLKTLNSVGKNLDYCVNTYDSSNTVKTKVGYQYWFANKEFLDGRTIKLSVVEPFGRTHAPHVHEEDEFFFVLEGEAELFLNGKTKIVGQMTSFYCPPFSKHGISNAGKTELKYLVIKKYKKL